MCDRTIRRVDRDTHWHCGECDAAHPFLATTLAARSKHTALFHTDMTCSCGAAGLPLLAMQQHCREVCPQRRIVCRFCFNEMEAGAAASDPADRYRGYTEHESRCGSKTSQCDECGVHVRRRDLEMHAKLHSLGTSTNDGRGGHGARASASSASASGVSHPKQTSLARVPTDAERAAAWARAGFGGDSFDGGGSAQASPWPQTTMTPSTVIAPAAVYPPGFLDPVVPASSKRVTPPTLCCNEGCLCPAAEPANLLGLCSACWSALPPRAEETQQQVCARSLWLFHAYTCYVLIRCSSTHE